MTRIATSPADYESVYARVLAEAEEPVILHWLDEMFDPALAGYWGARAFPPALETALAVIHANAAKIDGIKLSLLDDGKERAMRRRLPSGVRMYTGDDFNYPALIEGDDLGHSHALLGIFDPIAPAASAALSALARDNVAAYRRLLEPTVPLSRLIFRAPTRHYKTGVVFLAYLNGFQEHFVMIGGAHGTTLAMVFKLITTASKTWRRLMGNNQLPKVIEGVRFKDGMQIDETKTRATSFSQPLTHSRP